MAQETCTDTLCPFHGSTRLRGRTFTGIVTSSKMRLSAKVEWTRMHYIPKYERSERRKSKVIAHNPVCIGAIEGDVVKIVECRPLSKRKNFVITEKLGTKEFIAKEQLYEVLGNSEDADKKEKSEPAGEDA